MSDAPGGWGTDGGAGPLPGHRPPPPPGGPVAGRRAMPPPLRDLPDPPQIPPEPPATVAPEQIVLPSRRVLAARMLQAAWLPALILLILWYLLLTCYVMGTSPTFWTLGLLSILFEPGYFAMLARAVGFSPSTLGLAYLLLPVLATLASLALLPVSVHRVATMDPRAHLTEDDFQRCLARRAAAPLMIPPLAAIALVTVLALTPISPHWQSLSAGVLAALSAGLLWCLLAWLAMRGRFSATHLLEVPSPAAQLGIWDRSTRTVPAAERARRLAVLVTQDRRHLPPVRSRLEPGPAEMLVHAGRSLRWIAGAALYWVAPVALPLSWMIFTVQDLVVVIQRITSTQTFTVARAEQPWQVFALGVPLLLVLAGLVALAPHLAMLLAAGTRGAVTDERTYPTWEERAERNPWEVRVVNLTGVLVGLETLLITAVYTVLLLATGGMSAVGWVWVAVDVLLLVPLLGLGASWAMRRRLRDVLYGPAGRYVRRRTPFVLVAPEGGIAPLRHVAPAGPARHASHADPYRAADAEAISQGILPDFGAAVDEEAPREDPHRIPDTETGLHRHDPPR